MKLTLKMKMRSLTRNKEWMLERSMEEFKSCVNDWLNAIAQLREKPNRANLHRFAYKRIRSEHPQLHSNVVQDAMNLAIEIYRSWLKKGGSFPEFHSDVIYFKGVDVKIENNGLVVPLMGERVYLPLYVPKKFKKYLKGFKNERVFRCPKCGFQLDRDLNAARNIAKRAFLPAVNGEASSPQRR